MNLTELRNKFLETEEKYNFFDIDADGFKYWQYIRLRVFYDLQDAFFSFNKGENKWQRISLKDKMKITLHSLYLSVFKNPLFHFRQKDILIFTGSRRIKKNKKDYDIYFDELIERSDYSFNVLEDYFQGNDYREPYSGSIAYMDFLYFFQKIINKVIKIDKKLIKSLDVTLSTIEKEFDTRINRKKIEQFFSNFLIEHKYLRKYYKRIIKKASPKLILQTVSYGTWKQIFNEEAKKMNIPVVELQHGFMGPYQIPYNFQSKRNVHSFPDYILTFGDFWNETTDFPITKENIICCGFPYFENNIVKTNEEKAEVSDKNIILFISQPTIAEGLAGIALELADIIDIEANEIIYKLHPIEYNDNSEHYTKLRNNKKITVTDENSEDLYYYFSIANAQVGVYSTAIVEGLGFELKTYIAKLYGYEWMSELYKNSYAQLVSSAEEIAEIIDNPPQKYNIESFWKPNSLQNILKSIDKIINKNN